MNKLRDVIRFVLISPEVVLALVPFLVFSYAPWAFDALLKPMKEGVGFGLGAAAIPLGMLAFSYKEGFDMLAPGAARKLLLEWPDYPLLKNRIIASMIWCVAGAGFAAVATWMVASNVNSTLGSVILVSGILASAASTATIGLARFTLRDILGE